MTPIAIVGISCMFPAAPDREAYWANLVGGRDCITQVPESHWRPADHYDADQAAPDRTYGRRGGFIEPFAFDPLAYGISPRDIEATDTTQLLGMVVARRALDDAGYHQGGRPIPRAKTSVIIGVTGTLELVIPLGARLGHPIWRRALADAGVDPQTAQDVVQRIGDGYVSWQENSFPGLLGNVVAGRIANRLDLHGTNCVVDAACASSLSAMHLASMELAAGKADLVVTGGMDTFNDVFMYMCFSKTPALSARGDARPFDAEGDGTILGEGLGVVVLKRLEDAQRDGDRIYAVMRSVGSASDGKGEAIYAPSSAGQARALRDAYEHAGVSPTTIELVEAHGTGTRVGDATEIGGLREVFGGLERRDAWCSLGSVKSMIGHTKAAAGAAGLIKAALALHHQVMPPTGKVTSPNEALVGSPFTISTRARPWIAKGNARHPRRAGVSAFGFGGSNFHAVLEEYPHSPTVSMVGDVQLLAFSAADRSQLIAELERAANTLEVHVADDERERWGAIRSFAEASRDGYAADAGARISMVVTRDGDPVHRTLREAARMIGQQRGDVWSTPQGIYFAEGHSEVERGLTAAVFPGQGAQRVSMLEDLALSFRAVRAAFEAAEAVGPVADLVFPPTAFDEARAQQQRDRLRQTQFAQPALGAVEVGAFRVAQLFGVPFHAAAGHSFGELVALHAAGRVRGDQLHVLARLRGRLMGAPEGDRGSMVAVSASKEQVATVLADHDLQLVIANHNTPRQLVLSGPTPEIERAVAVLAQAGLDGRRLEVGAAFHSPLVAGAARPFAEALERIDLAPGPIPVYANTTGDAYPDDASQARRLLAGQLAAPVQFVRCIENMYADGVRTFVELGPGRKVAGMVREILGERAAVVVSIDASAGRRAPLEDLARMLAELSVRGQALTLRNWDPQWRESPARARLEASKPRFSVTLTGANVFEPKHRPATPARAPAVAAAPAGRPQAPAAAFTAAPPLGRATPGPPPAQAASPQPQSDAARLAALTELAQTTAQLHQQFLSAQARTADLLAALGQQLPGQSAAVAVAAPARVPVPNPVASPAASATAAEVEPPAMVQATAASGVDVSSIIMEVVAEATGYPPDMLELSMGLDADLGIDSIKRVEIFSALAQRLSSMGIDAPLDAQSVAGVATLEDVRARIAPHAATARAGADPSVAPRGERPLATPAAAAQGEGEGAVQTGAGQTSPAAAAVLGVVAEATGYPKEMLELSMGLDADLGIDSIKRVEVFSALAQRFPAADLSAASVAGVSTLGDIVKQLGAGPAGPETPQRVAAGVASTRDDAAPSPTQHAGQAAGVVLEVVSAATGYPAEMLDASMGLDADLGIDSIKRVEIFSALSTRFPAADLSAQSVAGIVTLADVIERLGGGGAGSGTAIASSEPAMVEPTASADVAEQSPKAQVYAVVPRALGRPRNATRTPAGAVLVTRTEDGLSTALCGELRARGVDARELGLEELSEIDGSGVGGVFLLDERHDERGDERLVLSLLAVAKLGEALSRAADRGGALVCAVSRLDGSFGLGGLAPDAPVLGGGLAGLVKTIQHEWPKVTCRAIDLDRGIVTPDDLEAAAAELTNRVFSDGPVEIGIDLECAMTPTLERVERESAQGPVFEPDDVMVVSGGARGVTAGVAIALTERGLTSLALLGRSPLPEAAPPWLEGIEDAAGVKRALLERQRGSTPGEIERATRRLLADREMRQTLAALRQRGVRVLYRAVDVRDRQAVATVIAEVSSELGPVTGLIHGAGVLADKRIEDKTEQDVRAVYETKVAGARALLAALAGSPLRTLVLFSSSTARFGRSGQSDYAMANEVLNKIAAREHGRRPDARVLSVNWGPWDGGMVTPALARLFAKEGVALIGPSAGATMLIDELAHASVHPGQAELVVLGGGSSLPVRTQPAQPAEPIESEGGPTQRPAAGPRITGRSAGTVRVSTRDVPILAAHVIGGRAVVPMALSMEWLAHAALHGQPGLRFVGFDEVFVLRGLSVSEDQQLEVEMVVTDTRQTGSGSGQTVVEVHLCVSGRPHVRGQVRLGPVTVAADGPVESVGAVKQRLTPDQAYESILFHGPALQALGEILLSDEGVSAKSSAAPVPKTWIEDPVRGRWVADPMAIDAAFQLAIVFTDLTDRAPNLPSKLEGFSQYRPFPREGVEVRVRVLERVSGQARFGVQWVDAQGELVAQARRYTVTVDEALRPAFARRSLAAR